MNVSVVFWLIAGKPLKQISLPLSFHAAFHHHITGKILKYLCNVNIIDGL